MWCHVRPAGLWGESLLSVGCMDISAGCDLVFLMMSLRFCLVSATLQRIWAGVGAVWPMMSQVLPCLAFAGARRDVGGREGRRGAGRMPREGADGVQAVDLTEASRCGSPTVCDSSLVPPALRRETALGKGEVASLADAHPSLPAWGLCQRERKPKPLHPWQVLLRLRMTFPSGLSPRDSVSP